MSVNDPAASLRAAHVPPPILEVARVLQGKGHAAVLVGGAVRDVLLGLDAEDWDLATSARPDEVQAAFRRTVPTGIEHGTITVLVRGPDKPIGVEVTTFRGEGAYTDGRRPSEITFLRDLVEDLARRDFTVNAFAWDPIAEVFTDPFDGIADLATRTLRAVGDPARRFAEDGLRTMRAVRLCATRELALENATAAAIGGALDVLAKVSRERVHVELVKLLGAAQPSRGLVPMHATGVWPHALPVLDAGDRDAAILAVDALPRDAVLRCVRLLVPARRPEVDAALEGLRFGRNERARIVALLGDAARELTALEDPIAIRRAAARLGRGYIDDAIAIATPPAERVATLRAALERAVLEVGELAIGGRDLLAEGIAKPGPALGAMLKSLLDHVLERPQDNERELLFARAREL
jgi:tRNA nucleotidyltransferase (CCA-adding enzyme)